MCEKGKKSSQRKLYLMHPGYDNKLVYDGSGH